MAYRQHASGANTNTGNQAKDPASGRADDSDRGGTVLMQRISAASHSQLTLSHSAGDNLPMKKPPSAFPAASTNTASKADPGDNVSSTSASSARRRQSSIPSAKVPLGPRPLDYGTGKRLVMAAASVSNSTKLTPAAFARSASNPMAAQLNSLRGPSAGASQKPYTCELSINDISRFSFASIQAKQPSEGEGNGSLDFGNFLEPTFNFDDFQDTIVGPEPSLNHFPLPGRGANAKAPSADTPVTVTHKPVTQPAIPVPARKGPGGTTVTRRGSTASNISRNSNKSDSMTATSTSILRGRRQSHFPPNSFNNPNSGAKVPRKSVGPGTFIPPQPSEKGTARRRPSVGGRKSSAESAKSLSLKSLGYRADESVTGDIKTYGTVRPRPSIAAKRQASKDLLTPSRTPDFAKSTSSSSAHHTPTRGSGTPGRTTTPGANNDRNRRVSVMPHHATGLGARTVSPTDARRMKRMSSVPPAPPLPQNRISQAPPTPQPAPVPQLPQPDLQSPAGPTRKSATPSSSRTTPDPNRKSYSSGQSLSSNTSYSSVRNTVNNAARLSQTLTSSRLPAPKPRLDTSTTSTQGLEVPPVPAIPKAYESPGSELDQPFFSARSSSLPPFDEALSTSPGVSTLVDAMNALETPRAPSPSSHISGPSPHVETEPRPIPQRKASKKNPQTLRLPPLNLLPLSTPTSAKIKSLNDKSESGERPATPPGTRYTMKTPSTPMTASKASFFTRHKPTEEALALRSSTSHHALRSDDLRPPSGVSPNLPAFAFEMDEASRRNISPYVSSSLPKSNDDFSNFMRPNFGPELSRNGSTARPNGPRAPSFSVTPKAEIQPSPVEKHSESESGFSTSLRRRLSRKRSEQRVPEPVQQSKDPARYDNMPPPKLPASASWTNPHSGNSSPSQKPSYIRSRRQTSTSSTTNVPERQGSQDSSMSHASNSRPLTEAKRTLTKHTHRSGSLSASTHDLLADKAPGPRQHEPALDRDDMIAEEEMKKLASRRKDFESAARELDTLRARARPARRMSAGTAAKTFDLNIFERGEIVDYPDIYFTGTSSAKKIVGDLSSAASNFGYDDERGDYNIVEGDHLAYRYEVVDLLGKGSFGQVVRCVDHKTGILVAVKIIRNKKRFHQQALVEVNILQKLKEWVSRKHSRLKVHV